MVKQYKYHIALSFAVEDIGVAEQVAQAIKKLNTISYYFYPEHISSNWGKNGFQISLDTFGNDAQYMLMLISKNYIEKYWSNIERQIAQNVTRHNEPYVLPLYIEDEIVQIDGLGKDIFYVKWENDPDNIARLLYEKISGSNILEPSTNAANEHSTKERSSETAIRYYMSQKRLQNIPEDDIIADAHSRFPVSREYLAFLLNTLPKV